MLQLENMRIREFYHASLSEAIAYAEMDLEGGQLKAAGGLWSGYEKEYSEEQGNLLQFMWERSQDMIRMQDTLEEQTQRGSWKEILANGEPIQRYRYQRRIDGEWHWVELVVHRFREQFSENMYALLYLKDIDAQVRKELAQQKAASRDPLTGVYNRKAFQSEVCRYMEDPAEAGQGVFILLDIDNFKTVNDQYGHLAGDEVLLYVTKQLESTFRRQDLVGRLGGDEFMVFLKGAVCREILDQRMKGLYEELGAYPRVSVTCSAGIAFVERENFSYQNSILQADMALYRSKQDGKHHYTYAEEEPLAEQ